MYLLKIKNYLNSIVKYNFFYILYINMGIFHELMKPVDYLVKKIFGKKFLKQSIVNRIFILSLFFLIFRFIMGMYNVRHFPLEGFNQGDKFILYHMNECGHCKKMMPEWDKLPSQYKGVTIMKKERNDSKSDIEKYNIQSFPTMLIINKNGKKVTEYTGDRNKNAFLKFLD